MSSHQQAFTVGKDFAANAVEKRVAAAETANYQVALASTYQFAVPDELRAPPAPPVRPQVTKANPEDKSKAVWFWVLAVIASLSLLPFLGGLLTGISSGNWFEFAKASPNLILILGCGIPATVLYLKVIRRGKRSYPARLAAHQLQLEDDQRVYDNNLLYVLGKQKETEALFNSHQQLIRTLSAWSVYKPIVDRAIEIFLGERNERRDVLYRSLNPKVRSLVASPVKETADTLPERVKFDLAYGALRNLFEFYQGSDGDWVLNISPPVGVEDKKLDALADVLASDFMLGEVVKQERDIKSHGEVVFKLKTKATVHKLPTRASIFDILPHKIEHELSGFIPVGLDSESKVVSLPLHDTPHIGIYGETNSGKSVALRNVIMSALARGYKFIMIDPVKGGLDFKMFKPFATAWSGKNFEKAEEIIERVYKEVARRQVVIDRLDVEKTASLTFAQQVEEDCLPILVVVDELQTALGLAPVVKGLPKDHPKSIATIELNTHKAILSHTITSLAAEARYVGIHLAVATQRPDVTDEFPGQLRANLKAVVQLVSPTSPPNDAGMTMAFQALATQAKEQLKLYNDGSKGLAVIASSGGTAKALRVAFSDTQANPGEYYDALTLIDVPVVKNKWFEDDTDENDVVDEIDESGSDGAAEPLLEKPEPAFGLPF